MSESGDAPVLSTLTTIGSEGEANIVRAVLADAGIDSFVPNLNAEALFVPGISGLRRGGLEVLVPTAQLEDAKEVLASLGKLPNAGGPHRPAVDGANVPACEAYAAKVPSMAMLTFVFPPAMLFAAYYFLRAHWQASQAGPSDETAYRKNMGSAVVAVVGVVVWIVVLSSWASPV
jgi:hypothetical protein